jgi:F0F1-type ATP synthase membrane subunit c/vacuolar-type H+-ATPase subunit K
MDHSPIRRSSAANWPWVMWTRRCTKLRICVAPGLFGAWAVLASAACVSGETGAAAGAAAEEPAVVSEVFTEGVAGVSAEEFAGWFAELGVFIAPNCSGSRAGAESAGWTKLGTHLIPGMGTTGRGSKRGSKNHPKIPKIPRYNPRLCPGPASWHDTRAGVVQW